MLLWLLNQKEQKTASTATASKDEIFHFYYNVNNVTSFTARAVAVCLNALKKYDSVSHQIAEFQSGFFKVFLFA